jgi:hypothetical protein
VTATKDIEVTITQPRKEKRPLKLQFFFVIKGEPKRYAKQAGVLDLPEGEGSAVFSTSAQQGQQRFVFMGFRESSGERIEGWFVRALNNDRIIGIAASSPSLEELAAYPEKLKGLLTADCVRSELTPLARSAPHSCIRNKCSTGDTRSIGLGLAPVTE